MGLARYSHIVHTKPKNKSNMENLSNTLRTLLAKNIVRFTFRKVDGTIRTAIGTRNLGIASATLGYEIPMPKGDVQPYSYYDLEKCGWRSYKPNNLISIDGIEKPKPSLPKREIPISGLPIGIVAGEMPSHTDKFPISEIIGAIFGGGIIGEQVEEKPTDKMADLLTNAKTSLTNALTDINALLAYLNK